MEITLDLSVARFMHKITSKLIFRQLLFELSYRLLRLIGMLSKVNW